MMRARSGLSGSKIAVTLLFLTAATSYAWNAYDVTRLTGYDSPAHAAYVLSILEEGRLPHPFGGWSTFHPPLYYLIGALVWRALEPLGPVAIVFGLRAISAAGCLAMGGVAYFLVRSHGGRAWTAWVAAALVLFVPVVQMAAAMVGNEALAAGLAALALPLLARLQRDPADLRSAAGMAALVGLALITKFSAVYTLAACVVPFARRDLDARALRAILVASVVGAAIVAPVYVRNVIVADTPLPMTRDREPMKSAEAANVLRDRRVSDYLWLDPACLVRPSIHHVVGEPGPSPRRNPAMTNVWGLVHASTWYDAFGHRIPLAFHRDGVWFGTTLAVLGLVPALVMCVGFVIGLVESIRTRFRCPEAPLVAIWLAGLASFVMFTWQAPSLAAVKSSYLLPLVVPGAVFFARAVDRVGRRTGSAVLTLSGCAALLAAVVFTSSLVFPPLASDLMSGRWRMVGGLLPGSYIREAVDVLAEPRRDGR